MPVVKDLICADINKGISFGNYELEQKAKADGFEFNGDIYKVKTFSGITKLEKNGMFVYESVPGTAVTNLQVSDEGMTFMVEGLEATQITVELEPDRDYKIYTNNTQTGFMQTNVSGKLAMSVELCAGSVANVKIEKVG